jgi:hypothetical protein
MHRSGYVIYKNKYLSNDGAILETELIICHLRELYVIYNNFHVRQLKQRTYRLFIIQQISFNDLHD